MNTMLKYCALATLTLFCLCIAYGTHAYFFFSRELQHQGITESVRVGTRMYSVDKGMVFSGDARITGVPALRALRIAYGKALAERLPLMGLEGTNPDALRKNTTLLKKTMDEISLLQKTSEDASLVRNALYPIDFLYALSSLESKRMQFIASGSELDLHSYQQSFDPVFRYGMQDSKRLIDAFAYETLSAKPPKTVGFAGTMTATSTTLSFASIPNSLVDMRKQVNKRSLCLYGVTWLCPTLSLPAIALQDTEPLQTDVVRTLHTFNKTRIASLFRLVTKTSVYDKLYTPVDLERSTCLASLPAPYNMETSILLQINFDLFHYLNNMYFIPTAGESGPVPEFLRDTYGLTYLKINPMAFYLCPHLVEDVSVAQATLRTAALARNYPDIPNPHRAALLSGVPDSKDAIGYMRDATSRMERETLPTAYTQELISLSLMFTQKGAGLDAVVAHIVDISAHDLRLVQEGAPFDLSAKNLFYTHTAAPSLFLFHQTGALSPLTPNTPDDWDTMNKRITSYSDLRTRMADAMIIHQIRSMKQIEEEGL